MAQGPGDVIGGRYRLLDKLGAGAYGVVYRARDLETREEVAVKLLIAGRSVDPELQTRFEREAIAMAKLRGTSAVYVHGIGRDDRGRIFIVMELLRGGDLESFLKRAEERGGRLKRKKMLELLRPIAGTLEAAHKLGIVHRDLKPSNIFVVDAGHGGGVRLMDFGLAKLIGADSLTGEGMVAGTPSYIAPEAWRGNPKDLDHRIDVYSLGVMVFRCLAGQAPYVTSSLLDLCRWAQQGARPSLRDLRQGLPAGIDPWVEKALAIDPADRFQNVRSMWSSLEALLAEEPRAPF
jgi:serine/threonine-protein kinase